MKKFLALFITAVFIASNCYGVDINDWKRGDASIPVKGTDNISDADTLISNYIADPLDRLLTNYRTGCQLVYTSATTVTIQLGEIVCSNSAGTIRRMRKNTATTTVVLTTAGVGGLDDGAEANVTYYVYAVADADATTFTAICSANATTPVGITYYRYLGNFANVAGDISAASVTGVGAGRVVQVVNYQRTDQVTCATAIPNDNNSRTSAEGNLVLTKSITPKSNSNKLRIDVVVQASMVSGAQYGAIILMDGTTVLATGRGNLSDTATPICLTYFMSSPGTSAKTFNVNLGVKTGTCYLNSISAAAVDNGACTSSITITEIEG
jgi:hypothetical protein